MMCVGCCVCCLMLFFFFKQKTAYEMRISDWSSDVCSSDLRPDPWPSCRPRHNRRRALRGWTSSCALVPGNSVSGHPLTGSPAGSIDHGQAALPLASFVPEGAAGDLNGARSEEHTFELQSLLRHSYAVFFLKNKHTRHSLL